MVFPRERTPMREKKKIEKTTTIGNEEGMHSTH